ncbi:hypothetical protein A4G99_14240 [Haladaptatus sp. R4]|uniref:SGNH/GDSL hydrolase family protein n=1 Tax=Haladaptatus sp. R4 TaxID=1679489 RepID=UPI0007B4CBC6|nr:SGNH/GDSL hydrolase family protein [Haladaptatus sp. R4]KZN23216.1 hypothetical protein A4G99_14240 [Haladaptatus sp. R4]
MFERRTFLKAVGAATGISATGVDVSGACESPRNGSPSHGRGGAHERFVGAWSGSPVPPGQSGLSRTGFENRTLREIVHTSVGGSAVRIRLTNEYGTKGVTIDAATVGIRDTGATVLSKTNRTVTFGGEKSVFIPAGAVVYSDPIELSVEPDQDLAVSLYASAATGPATWHPLALHTTYISQRGNHTADADGDQFTNSTQSWFFLGGVDVIARKLTSTIVAFGDSITDGFNSTPGADHTWPDYLARRLTDHRSVHRSIVNAGISGNRLLHDANPGLSFGNNALARLDHDVIEQPNVSDVIILEGINDIGQYPPAVTAEQMIAGLTQIAKRVHASGSNIFAGTLTPTRGAKYGNRYDSPEGEAKREMVNRFIRTTDVFDGVIDFDAAIRDPAQPDRIRPEYDSGDHLHPSDAGYRAMADAVDLSLFKRTHRHTR